MPDNVLHDEDGIRVTNQLLITRTATYAISSILAFGHVVERRTGFFRKVKTARLFVLLNNGTAHELAGEDIARVQRLKLAIEVALGNR
jgi:hypothetical protein